MKSPFHKLLSYCARAQSSHHGEIQPLLIQRGSTASGSVVSNVNPESYGIYVSNVVNPSVSISISGTGILGATIVPDTWFSATGVSGSYNFTYYVPDLQEDPTGIEGWY